MKAVVQALIFGVALTVGSVCIASEIHVGDSLSEVLLSLGPAPGRVDIGSRTVLYYERGQVELQDGHVVTFDLISEKEAQDQRLAQERQADEARRAAEQRRSREMAEGMAIRDQKLADPVFLSMSPAERVAYWASFNRQYPDVPLGSDDALAMSDLQVQMAAEQATANQQQMAELQQRTADAEQRAAAAEAAAQQAYAMQSDFVASPAPVFVTALPSACQSSFGFPVRQEFGHRGFGRHEEFEHHQGFVPNAGLSFGGRHNSGGFQARFSSDGFGVSVGRMSGVRMGFGNARDFHGFAGR